MSESLNEPVASDQLRLSVEMGDDYVPTPRLATALDELAAALLEAEQADDDEVVGFNNFEEVKVAYRSFGFDSVLGGSASSFGTFKYDHWIDKSSTDGFGR